MMARRIRVPEAPRSELYSGQHNGDFSGTRPLQRSIETRANWFTTFQLLRAWVVLPSYRWWAPNSQ